MLFKKLFLSFDKNDKYFQIEQKVQLLELEVQRLHLLEKKWEQQQEENKQPPIIIEKVHVDKILFDKFELNNNFGQLGIKELKGRLNIGATYGSDFFHPEVGKETEEKKEESGTERKKPVKPLADGPKVNIYPKKET